MSINVELVDAHAAIELVQFAYFKKIVEKPRKKRRTSDGEEYGTEDEADFEEGMDVDGEDSSQQKKKERKSRQPLEPLDGNEYMPQEDGVEAMTSHSVTETTIEPVVEMDTEKFDYLKKILNEHFQKLRKDALDVEPTIQALIQLSQSRLDPLTRDQIDWALKEMEKANQVMVVDGQIFLI